MPPRPEPPDPADVLRAAHAEAPRARLGVVVYDLRSGSTLLEHHADQRFRSASLVKLLIAVDALRRDDPGPRLHERIHRMLALSDDDLASEFWERGGGPDIVEREVARIGLTGTAPPADPGMWGNTLVTARDVVRTYRYILTALPSAQRTLIMQSLGDAPRRAADGWDQYFGIPDAVAGTGDLDWAVKQGWSDSGDDLVLHTTGVLGEARWHYVVVLLLSDGKGTGWVPLRRALTSAASAILPSLA